MRKLRQLEIEFKGVNDRLVIVPIFQKEAFDFVEKFHRHHKKPRGSVFQLGVSFCGRIVGVSVVGRPVARFLQDGYTLEVIRLCTDGTENAPSMLYSASWRVARELGYRKLITYILGSETGISLKAAGWNVIGERGGGSWDRPSRPRADISPTEKKILYQKL
jgi:hypothetical protein